jgi:hypothetical protein
MKKTSIPVVADFLSPQPAATLEAMGAVVAAGPRSVPRAPRRCLRVVAEIARYNRRENRMKSSF